MIQEESYVVNDDNVPTLLQLEFSAHCRFYRIIEYTDSDKKIPHSVLAEFHAFI